MRVKVQHGEVTEYRPSLIIKPSTLNTWFVLHHYRVLFQISNQLFKKKQWQVQTEGPRSVEVFLPN